MHSHVFDTAFSTRRRFYAALKQNGAPTPKQLSVSRICQSAHLSRATFYRHFKSIDDFLSCFLDDGLTDALAGYTSDLSFYQAISLQCATLANDQTIRQFLTYPENRLRLERVAQGRIVKHLSTLINTSKNSIEEAEVSYFMYALATSLPPLYFDWLIQLPYTPAQFASNATSILPEALLASIGNSYL